MEYEISPLGTSYPLTVNFLIIIIFLVIFVMMMVWVYKDAKQRNMEPVLYLVLVFFFGCCGLMIYFIARAEHPNGEQEGIYGSREPRMDTTHRGQSQYDQSQYDQSQYDQSQYDQSQYDQSQYDQSQYGQSQAPPPTQPQKNKYKTKFCRYCGGEMPNDALFCSICGANEFNN